MYILVAFTCRDTSVLIRSFGTSLGFCSDMVVREHTRVRTHEAAYLLLRLREEFGDTKIS